jgi:hypothetical protein
MYRIVTFLLHKWPRERAAMFRYTYIAPSPLIGLNPGLLLAYSLDITP